MLVEGNGPSEEETEGLETFLVKCRCIEGLDIHGKNEAMRSEKLKVIEEL